MEEENSTLSLGSLPVQRRIQKRTGLLTYTTQRRNTVPGLGNERKAAKISRLWYGT